jgi:hypothetical protein
MHIISKCNEKIVHFVNEMPTNESISELEDSTIKKCNDNIVSAGVKPTPKQNNIARLFRYLKRRLKSNDKSTSNGNHQV